MLALPMQKSEREWPILELCLLSPTDIAKLLADDTEKWAEVIRTANIKLN
jgi:hypothetical protein